MYESISGYETSLEARWRHLPFEGPSYRHVSSMAEAGLNCAYTYIIYIYIVYVYTYVLIYAWQRGKAVLITPSMQIHVMYIRACANTCI